MPVPAPDRIALVLDMDGVIIDSSQAKSDIFVAVFASRWPDWQDRVKRYNEAHFGVPRARKIRQLLAQIAPDEPVEPLLQTLLDDYARRLEHALTAFPLISGLAEVMHSRSFDIFVCSAAPMNEIRLILDHHGLFSLVPTIFDGETRKSDALTRIAGDYGARCLFVGDAAADQQAAATAGVRFILCRSGAEKAIIDADLVIDDFSDFASIVENLDPAISPA